MKLSFAAHQLCLALRHRHLAGLQLLAELLQALLDGFGVGEDLMF